ncbi:hypothetical protein SprV_0301360000 [Sparganum proliferum]
MTRVLIDDCHRRLQKYKAEIEENRRQCVHILGDSITADLGKTISALAHNRQAKKREILGRKLTKLKPPGAESSNLVHNLSSKQLTEQQLRVLQHETCFNTADADPVDIIAALEAMLFDQPLIRGRRIQSDEIMVSFDVTSLFTSIPPKVTREVLRERLEEAYDETQNALKIEHLMRLFEFCQQTFFTFAGETYEQIKGTPMGSPVSCLLAELVLQKLEKIAFLQHEPVFWRRYVDDTFVIVRKDMLQHFHSLLNAVFPDIKFTREEEQEQQLPFLDVLVRRNLNGELETTVYRKATNITQLLSFHSNHPVAHKRSCVKTLFKRVQTHCSKPEDRARKARYLRDQFVQNGYPRAFISPYLRGRHQRSRTSTPPTIWHSLPYIKGVSEATELIAADLGVGIAHRPKATMRKRVMKIKERLKPEEQSGVVYRIPCQNCPCNYTGQTGRMLGSRTHEHKLAVRRGDALSQVAAHTYEMGHEFNFAATKIVAHAGNKTGRELIEAWASDGNSVNRFIDLAPAYRALRSHLQACDVGR